MDHRTSRGRPRGQAESQSLRLGLKVDMKFTRRFLEAGDLTCQGSGTVHVAGSARHHHDVRPGIFILRTARRSQHNDNARGHDSTEDENDLS
jgi:hypothetical protein